MGYRILHRADVGELVARQHGVVARRQLLELGLSPRSIHHHLACGRLHRVWLGVYAFGRPQLSLHGRWMAAVLRCGPGAVLSHETAAALWEIHPVPRDRIDVSVPANVVRRARGIVAHRRRSFGPLDIELRFGIPVSSPVITLIDIAARLDRRKLESAINEADKRDLVSPEELRSAVDECSRRPGIAVLRELLDRLTFTLTDSELERCFLPLARKAGLGLPKTGWYVNGFKVDFYWPELGLVVETDGLRYHRTPSQQARDRVRDQAHIAAGLTSLRFTRAQVKFEPDHVEATLAAVARRLRSRIRELGFRG